MSHFWGRVQISSPVPFIAEMAAKCPKSLGSGERVFVIYPLARKERNLIYYTFQPTGSGLNGCPTGQRKTERKKKMPKMKTKKCAVKRMKLSATGKVMRSQGGKAHLNNGKSRSRKRNLRGITTTDKTVQKTYARALQGGR